MVYRSTIKLKNLPNILPLFPLHGVLLLPGGRLPLNIFEPRYKALFDDALRGDRMIGMIQPKKHGGDDLYSVGCTGKVVEFLETPDGRYEVVLAGLVRFTVKEEIAVRDAGYRSAYVGWDVYADDLDNNHKCLDVCRNKLKELLEKYFSKQEMSCDWGAIDETSDGKLMTCLSMACPFDAIEKQALLEEKNCSKRAEMFIAMLEMAIHDI